MDMVFASLAFIDGVGAPEMMLIFVIILVLFGGEKLPQFARGLGKSIREFKKAAAGVEEEFKRALEEDERKQNTPQLTAGSSTTPTPSSSDPAGPDASTYHPDEYHDEYHGHDYHSENPEVKPETTPTDAATAAAAASGATPTASPEVSPKPASDLPPPTAATATPSAAGPSSPPATTDTAAAPPQAAMPPPAATPPAVSPPPPPGGRPENP